MNALDRKIMNAGKSTIAARILGFASIAALMSGCVGDPIASAKVDPNSPIAAEVSKQARADKDYPSFTEIPPAPTDVRPPRIYGQRAQELLAARDQLEAATAPGTWTLNNTQAFANRAQTDAGPSIDTKSSNDTEDFVERARRRATPPPPANR